MLTLVLGGAASGKSACAESLVLKTGLPRYYLATMQVWDAECAARVEKHRKMRAQKQFETLECPLHLDRLPLPGRGTVLLEDIGNLVANELYSPGGAGKHTAEAVLAGLERLAAGCDHLIVVSNEVFSGGADYAGDTDQYLLALAQVNNAFAARADNVCRVVCGLPVYYKGEKSCDCFADHRGGLCDVFGPAGAAVRVERKKYAVRHVRLPPHRAGVRRAVVSLRRPAPAGAGPGGGVLPRAGGRHRRHPSRRLRRHLGRPLELRRPRKKLEILKDSHCGAFAVIRLCCYFAAYFGLCGSVRFTPRAGLCWTLALVLERALSGFAVAAFPLAKDTGLAHTFATAADKQTVRRFLCGLSALLILALTALGGGGLAAAALLALWRYDFVAKKQFGGITGDLAGWFLQRAELWMLAALAVSQWGGML